VAPSISGLFSLFLLERTMSQRTFSRKVVLILLQALVLLMIGAAVIFTPSENGELTPDAGDMPQALAGR
jgi:hypothetical protein